MTVESRSALASVPFVVRGRVSEGLNQTPYGDTKTQATLDLDELVWPSHVPVPLADVPAEDIIDLLRRNGRFGWTLRASRIPSPYVFQSHFSLVIPPMSTGMLSPAVMPKPASSG